MFDFSFLLAQHEPSGGVMLVDKLARTPLSTIILVALVGTVLRLALSPTLAKIPFYRRMGSNKILFHVDSFLDAVIYAAVLIFMVVRPFVFQAFVIPSESMVPTLLENDLVGINKAVFRYSDPKPGDIVVFRPFAYACLPYQIGPDGVPTVDFIKRCQGVPGDVVEIRSGELYRNGQKMPDKEARAKAMYDFKLVEHKGKIWPVSIDNVPGSVYQGMVNTPAMSMPQLYQPQSDEEREELKNAPPAKIPQGFYLMIGDNRNESYDGRFWGLIPREAVVGRGDFIWFPLKRIRLLR